MAEYPLQEFIAKIYTEAYIDCYLSVLEGRKYPPDKPDSYELSKNIRTVMANHLTGIPPEWIDEAVQKIVIQMVQNNEEHMRKNWYQY